MFALALALSIAALFINPIGMKQILYPVDAMLHLPLNLNHVDEWRPLQLTDGRGITFLAVVGCIFLLLLLRQSELFLHELLLLSLAIWLAAGHQRMLFPFGILVAPILSRLLSSTWERYNAMQDRPWPNALLMAISLLIAFWGFPNRQDLAKQVVQRSSVKAV